MIKKLLIAEDNEVSREMLATYARSAGYEVVAVNDGVDLLNIAQETRFDAIITDLMMAPLDGAAATEILNMLGSTVPVIALTALEPHDLPLVENKFVKIFYKPCNFKELFEYVDSLTTN